MSGGKGGSQTQQVKIPAWMEEAAKRNLARAEAMSKVGYMPYYGPDVAGFGPTGDIARQANIDAAIAFGMAPEGTRATPMGDLSSGTLYDQAVAEYERRNPGAASYYNQFFVDPVTGAAPMYDQRLAEEAAVNNQSRDERNPNFSSPGDPYYPNSNSPQVGTFGSGYTGSQFGRDVGFGLANMPFSPVMNLIGEGIISNEMDAINRSFSGLPTTTGGDSGGGSSMGTGQSPTGGDVSGTPF